MMKKTPDTPAARPQAPVAEKNEVLAALMVKLETGQLSADEQQKLSELMPQAKNSLNVLQMAMKREQYSGPIPHPDRKLVKPLSQWRKKNKPTHMKCSAKA